LVEEDPLTLLIAYNKRHGARPDPDESLKRATLVTN